MDSLVERNFGVSERDGVTVNLRSNNKGLLAEFARILGDDY